MATHTSNNDESIDLARFQQAAKELESGEKEEALWFKAFAEANGNEQATKAAYIRLRVEQLRRYAVAAAAKTSAASLQSNTEIPTAHATPPVAGVKIPSSSTTTVPPESRKKIIFVENELVSAFIGPNEDYYTKKFETFSMETITFTWNWPAFLAGPLWFLYRKMYGNFLLLILVTSFFSGMADILSGNNAESASVIFNLIVVAVFAGYASAANWLYFKKTMKKIQPLIEQPYSFMKREKLISDGGVHMWVPWIIGGFWALIIVGGIIAAILIPDNKNYNQTDQSAPAYDPIEHNTTVNNTALAGLEIVNMTFECYESYCESPQVSANVKNNSEYIITSIVFGWLIIRDTDPICPESLPEINSLSVNINPGDSASLAFLATNNLDSGTGILACLNVSSVEAYSPN